VVDAPIAKVWEAVRDFHELDRAAPVITKVDKMGKFKAPNRAQNRFSTTLFMKPGFDR